MFVKGISFGFMARNGYYRSRKDGGRSKISARSA